MLGRNVWAAEYVLAVAHRWWSSVGSSVGCEEAGYRKGRARRRRNYGSVLAGLAAFEQTLVNGIEEKAAIPSGLFVGPEKSRRTDRDDRARALYSDEGCNASVGGSVCLGG
eukprot:4164759-Pleurochrysis_carterae.AAC.1